MREQIVLFEAFIHSVVAKVLYKLENGWQLSITSESSYVILRMSLPIG